MEIYVRRPKAELEVWDYVMKSAEDPDQERAWLVQNPQGFGCTEPMECVRQDGAYVEIIRQNGDWPEDFPVKSIQDRERSVWITLVNDHDQGATIIGLEPDAARALVNAVSEAISVLDRRGK